MFPKHLVKIPLFTYAHWVRVEVCVWGIMVVKNAVKIVVVYAVIYSHCEHILWDFKKKRKEKEKQQIGISYCLCSGPQRLKFSLIELCLS